ncbi:MAG: hypothetical protein R3Y38_07090 [Rikenellaceae bacterium]
MFGEFKIIYRKLFKKKKIKHILIDTRELYLHHNKHNEFSRYDMIVRYLAIENYYNKNDYGFDLYRKMQARRVGDKDLEQRVEIFKKLIESVSEKGFTKESSIILDSKLILDDGSHRFAASLYFKDYVIPARVYRSRPKKLDYSIKWFKVNGFTPEEIKILEDKNKEISEKVQVPFVCTLWSPAQEYFEQITQNLSAWGEVVGVKDFELDKSSYEKLVKGIYAVDDIASWKINYKLEKMKTSSSYKIRAVNLKLSASDFRLKKLNLSTLSVECEDIKSVIRTSYKKNIKDYFHDIIIHIGDNYRQNIFIDKLFHFNEFKIDSLVEDIANFNYVFLKFDAPYMPEDFPQHFPLGKDIDILCHSREDYEGVCEKILQIANQECQFKLRVVKKDNGAKTLFRIELEQTLIFQFDVSYNVDSFDDEFVKGLFARRTKQKGYYLPYISDELIIRLKEFKANDSKTHHKEFIEKNISDLNSSDCDKYLKFDWRKTLNLKK